MDREGTYYGSVLGGRADTSKSGNPQMIVELSLTHYYTGKEPPWEELPCRIERKMYISLSPNARPYALPRLDALGFNGDFMDPKFSPSTDPKTAPRFSNKHSEYQGKTSDRWDVAGIQGGKARGIEASVADELANEWRSFKSTNAPDAGPSGPPTRERTQF